MLELIITITIGIGFALSIYVVKATAPESKPKILPDLIPFKMHGLNVRSRLSDDEWNGLRNFAKKKKQFKCEVCGKSGKQQGFKHDVEAHEEWIHDHATRTQKLSGILVLCPLCHKFKHIGLAEARGYGPQVRKHIEEVNSWTPAQVELAINKARHDVMNLKGMWKLDLTYLNNYPYKLDGVTFSDFENRNCRRGVFE